MTLHRQTSGIPELPSLDPGLTLLETSDESRSPLQTLAIDRVLVTGGTATWLDSGHHAVTTTMSEIAPHRRVLDRIRVARAFTPYQHTRLLRRLTHHVDEATSLVVVPAVDFHYRSDDVRGADAQSMLVRGLAQLVGVAERHGVPILTSRAHTDTFAEPIEAAATDTLYYQDTPVGPQFTGEEFETQVYDLGNGWIQTTFAFWRDILEAREPVYEGAQAKREVAAGGAY